MIKLPVLIGGMLLLAGFMTPVVAVVIGLVHLGAAFFHYGGGGELVVLAGAVALLGPGAFSIDARLFGRREVFIPRRANELPAAPDRSRH